MPNRHHKRGEGRSKIRQILESKQIEPQGLRVGGKIPILDDVNSTIAQLQTLPSGFAIRYREKRLRVPTFDKGTAAGKLELEAQTLYATLRSVTSGHNKIHRQIIEKYIAAVAKYERAGMLNQQIMPLINIGNHYLAFGNVIDADGVLTSAKAVRFYKKAVKVSERSNSICEIYDNINYLYTAICRCCSYYSSNDDQVTLAKYKKMLKPLRELSHFYSRKLQGGMEPDAHRLEEGEYGFSALEKIGTDNASQCLTIIARDTVTAKTGLVHIDNQNDIESLNGFFAQFEPNPLQVRLVGARFTTDPRSRENIMAIMNYLKDKNADIISADIHNDEGPSAVVVDPVTFELIEKVPGIANENHRASNAVLLHTRRGEPLVQQFDFTVSPLRSPIYLSSRLLSKFREISFDHKEWEIEASLFRDGFSDRPLVVTYVTGLEAAYAKQWSGLASALEHAILCNKVDNEQADKAREALFCQGFYIGENAEAANVPIYDWINNQLFRDGRLQPTELNGVAVNATISSHTFLQQNISVQSATR